MSYQKKIQKGVTLVQYEKVTEMNNYIMLAVKRHAYLELRNKIHNHRAKFVSDIYFNLKTNREEYKKFVQR